MIELVAHIKTEVVLKRKQGQRPRQVTALSSPVTHTPYCKAETKPSHHMELSLHKGGSAGSPQ